VEGLAACVNILPKVTSVYAWQGELEVDVESTLLIKVRASGLEALSSRIRALHSYDTVEIVALDVDIANSDSRYLDWVRAAVPLEV